MTANTLIYLSSSIAAFGFALSALIFSAWGTLSRRGPARTRRLRIALSSVLLLIGAVLLSVFAMYFVVLPSIRTLLTPDFEPPYKRWSYFLSIIAPALSCTSVGLLIWATYRKPGTRQPIVLSSLICFAVFLFVSAANWAVTYSIQGPAYDRYVMIERRSWRTHVGNEAPDIEVLLLDGSRMRLSKLRGKVVLLDFFATWCGPCLYELPHLQQLWEDLHADGSFTMLAVSREEAQEAVAAFRSQKGYTLPMALDPDASAYHKFADEGIPRTYLISRDGTILYQSIGFAEIELYRTELATLRQMIEKELGAAP